MSVVCLVSDFITDEDVFGSAELRMLASRHDVIAIVPEDPAEVALPRGHGAVRMRDPESGRSLRVGLSSATREAYTEAVARASPNHRRRLLSDSNRLPVRPNR